MDEDMDISRRLKLVNEKLRQAGDASFSKFDLTGTQVGYLWYILGAGGSMSQKQLETAAGVSHPTIVGIVVRLQDKGYVEVRTDEEDRRNRIISLTDKAVNVTEQLEKGAREMNTRLIRGMTEEDKAELRRLLGIMEENLSGEPPAESRGRAAG